MKTYKNNKQTKCFTLFSFVLIGFSKWRKQQLKAEATRYYLNAETQRRKVFLRTQIAQIKGIISLALVINIPKIPNICGQKLKINATLT